MSLTSLNAALGLLGTQGHSQRPMDVTARVCFGELGKRPMMPLSWEERAGKKENAWPLSCLHTVVSAGTVLFYVFFSFFFLL